MGNIGQKIAAFCTDLLQSVRRYPLELALGVVYFILLVLTREEVLPGHRVKIELLLLVFYSHYLLLFWLHLLSKEHKVVRPLMLFVWLLWIPLLFVNGVSNWIPFRIAALATTLLLLLGTRPMDNETYAVHLVHMTSRMALGFVLGGFLLGVVEGIIGSLQALFDLDLHENWYLYPAFFVAAIVLPLLCSHLVAEERPVGRKGRFLPILIDLILSPALVIYTVILYAYVIRIALRWELPEGGVAYMVLCFLLVGMLCYLLRLYIEKRHFEWYFKAFPALALPPLVLLWMGTLQRIGDYGFTEARFYLLVITVVATVFVGMLFWERTRRFQVMTLVLIGLAVVFTYCPGLTARDFGNRSQQARLEQVLPELLQDGRFPEEYNYSTLDSLTVETIRKGEDAWTYLKGHMSPKAFEKRYGAYGRLSFQNWKWEEAVRQNDVEKAVYTLEEFDLGAYTVLIPDCLYISYKDDNQSVIIQSSIGENETLLVCPIQERLAQKGQDTDVLVYKNDRYMAVFSEITLMESGRWKWDEVYLFRIRQ